MNTQFLNEENVRRNDGDGVEWHPLHPFVPTDARVLFLGSFPPQRKRWCMNFYYPNWLNDHWRIEGLVFFGDKNHFVDEANRTFRLPQIVEFCEQRGIAFFDTATAVRRLADNASDKFLEVVVPTDIHELVNRMPRLRALVTTGEKACATLCEAMGLTDMPRVGQSIAVPPLSDAANEVRLFRLPSSSRAYPLALERKAEAYAQMFREIGML